MSRQKQNLLWLMIICYASCQLICSEKLIIQVNSTDQCFWNSSNSTVPDIKWKCLTAHEPIKIVKLNTSSLGQCRSYSFNIKQEENYEIRMNETIEGIKLWLLPNGSNYLLSVQNSSEIETCQAQGGIMSFSVRIPQTGCHSIDPVDPEEKCRNALYNNEICSEGKEGSRYRYILHLNESEWICVTCVDGRSTTITPLSHTTSHNSTTIFTSHMTTPEPTSFTPHTTTHNPTTSFTLLMTTPELTTSFTSHTTPTHNPTTSFTSHTTTHNPTTSFTSHTTTHNPTTSFTLLMTTPEPTTIFTSYTTTTHNPTTSFTLPMMTPEPTTSFTSHTTTTHNPTTSFTLLMPTPEPTTSFTSHTTTTHNPTTSFTSHTTTHNPTTSFTLHMTTPEPTTSFISHTTTRNPTTSFTSHTTTHNPTTSFTSHMTTDKPISTVKPPEITYNLTAEQNSEVGYTEPSKASKNLDKIKSLVEDMEKSNKTNAAIVMGNVIGVLLRQPKNTETKDINICYSSNQNMINVVESKLKTYFPWCIKIPSEAFDKSRLENNGSAFVGVLRFINMESKNETETHTVLNNDSYGITMGAKISHLTNNIDIFIKKNNTVGNASCVSWDEKEGKLNWTTFGCETERINDITIKCSCSHLTCFSVLMHLPDIKITAPHPESLTFISSIGCGISMFFLAVALFMHFQLRKAKSNQATKILMNMFVALFLLNASFLSNESIANTQDNAACVFIALLLHYSMLASFTWFFIHALHMYLWLIRQNVTITNYMRKITVLGWVCPAPIVIVIVSVGGYEAMILNETSGNIIQMCWITNPYIHYTVNIGYFASVFIFMTGTFITILTTVVHAKLLRATDGKRKQLMMVLSLFLLFGLTWSVVFFSYGPMRITLYYIFTVLNSLQGIFLFLYYYHIRNDVAGNFSDDPESTDSTRIITQSSINAVENISN